MVHNTKNIIDLYYIQEMSNIFSEEIKEKKPRSEKQQANDKKLKDKFKSYHENKKVKADVLNKVIKEIEIDSDTELLINKIDKSVNFPSLKRKYIKKLHPGVKNIESQLC